MSSPLPDSLYSIFQHIHESFGPISRDVIRSLNFIGALDKKTQTLDDRIGNAVKNDGSTFPSLTGRLEDICSQKVSLQREKCNTINICIKMVCVRVISSRNTMRKLMILFHRF
ncbi:hypothetical protein RF11_07754 [Thelohanellus kitauei]|uniref:Uncharacterized protein n=1 Tax=Thelohanellus kitauei TaxID=669202 RepID=A0A0C2IYQ7_THEKT|nr:hypothetical protein RF11_07754 [Thelohanellus kitauei]